MQAGPLRQLIRIETPVETPDGAGGSTTAWTLLAETRAAIEPASPRELARAQAIDAEITHTVTIRFRAGVTSKCRVRYGNGSGARVFRIVGPPRDTEERHRELVLSCLEVLSEATS